MPNNPQDPNQRNQGGEGRKGQESGRNNPRKDDPSKQKPGGMPNDPSESENR